MKRYWMMPVLILCLMLASCAKAGSGVYKLDYYTADGVRMDPATFHISISFTLSEDGTGSASYDGTSVDINWIEEGSEVIVTGPNGELRFTQDGKTLILHDEGTILFFNPVEEEEGTEAQDEKEQKDKDKG